MKKSLLIALLCLLLGNCSYSAHLHPEKYYQELWCNAHNGKMEVELNDYTRIDCLTDNNAIEFDFAKKWAEAIGQSLHYSYKTGKKAGIVLILEKANDEYYFKRLIPLCKLHNIDLWKMSAPELNQK